jgi:2'-5' RNA ligase superfamily
MPREGKLETGVTLVLAEQAPWLAQAHDELYPERVEEGIPLSLTLLYPFAPRDELDDSRLERLRVFLRSRGPLAFDIARVAQWEGGGAVYGVPEPDEPLRATMRALWEQFPEFPPYGRPGSDPPPHASLTLDGGNDPATLRERVESRLEGLLPAHFELHEARLMEELEPDHWRLTHSFQFAQGHA